MWTKRNCVQNSSWSSWWPILYIRYFLTAYSVLITPNVDINPSSTWPSVYTSDFKGLFNKKTFSPSWANLYLGDILPPCTSGDLFCTSTSSWWRILYIRIILTTYSVLASPHFDIFSWILWPILYIYFSLMGLCLHILWLHVSVPLDPLLYTYLIMVTYSVHRKLLEWLSFRHTYFPMFDLFSKGITYSWPSLNTTEFYGLFCLFTSPWWNYLYIFYS